MGRYHEIIDGHDSISQSSDGFEVFSSTRALGVFTMTRDGCSLRFMILRDRYNIVNTTLLYIVYDSVV